MHLRLADYRQVPWANGRGATLELLRIEEPEGVRLRLSIAQVVEDGPFSVFPGILRSLTVIDGPGFRLEPVTFPGDIAVRAMGIEAGASEDFNVMTPKGRPQPEVEVLHGTQTLPGGGTRYLLALGPGTVNDKLVERYDLIATDGGLRLTGDGPVIVVTLRSVGTVALSGE